MKVILKDPAQTNPIFSGFKIGACFRRVAESDTVYMKVLDTQDLERAVTLGTGRIVIMSPDAIIYPCNIEGREL